MQNKRTLTLYIFIYVFSESLIHSKTFFKLDIETGRIEPFGAVEVAAAAHTDLQGQDEIFRIICKGPIWRQRLVNISDFYDVDHGNTVDDEVLDCGKPVNFTHYDDLDGVAMRFTHPMVPEPEVSYLFYTKKDTKSLDVDALERRLKKAKREKPKSVQLYNQIGNFWRIKGDTRQAIECFRRALAVSPTNAEVLLNLARVLYNLKYLEDALHLTTRSLDLHPSDKNPWKQHLTLGELYKSLDRHEQSQLHLKYALELAPESSGIRQAFHEMATAPSQNLHAYTILIILFLAMGVLLVVISSTDSGQLSDMSNQRHFNKVLLRSHHKVFRNIKCRK